MIGHFYSDKIKKLNFLVTGGAGFIGSNLVKTLLELGAKNITILDNLSTGNIDNITPFLNSGKVDFIQADIRDFSKCVEATKEIDIVFHLAALGSVPRSIKDPLTTHAVNSTGFINLLAACNQNKIKRIVFSSSSSVYGRNQQLPLKEDFAPQPISPYAVSKYSNELYASVFGKTYNLEFVGLRYFNVFGPNQSPNGAYAAVIPLFIQSLLDGKQPTINGTGETSRDFTYVDNVVQANLKAALVENPLAFNKIYNISAGRSFSLNQLLETISENLQIHIAPIYAPERVGDIKDSLADITNAQQLLDYKPIIHFEKGIQLTVDWFKRKMVTVNS
jgi:UDP-N-acetylglucosamine 4-epimerase